VVDTNELEDPIAYLQLFLKFLADNPHLIKYYRHLGLLGSRRLLPTLKGEELLLEIFQTLSELATLEVDSISIPSLSDSLCAGIVRLFSKPGLVSISLRGTGNLPLILLKKCPDLIHLAIGDFTIWVDQSERTLIKANLAEGTCSDLSNRLKTLTVDIGSRHGAVADFMEDIANGNSSAKFSSLKELIIHGYDKTEVAFSIMEAASEVLESVTWIHGRSAQRYWYAYRQIGKYGKFRSSCLKSIPKGRINRNCTASNNTPSIQS